MDKSYDIRELQTANAEAREIEKAPLAERREAQAEYLKAITTKDGLAWFKEQLEWMANGTYGRGVQIRVERILAGGPRTNKVAALGQLGAVYITRCPAEMAVTTWKKLTPTQKTALEKAIKSVIAKAR